MEWIKCSDRLPEDHAVCLILSLKAIGIARWTEEEGFHNDSSYVDAVRVYCGNSYYEINVSKADIKYWAYINDIPRPRRKTNVRHP
jgi:hypothetical protein